MEKSKNFYLSEKKFLNIEKNSGKKNKVIFFLPTIVLLRSKLVSWDIRVSSILFAFLKFNIQVNLYKNIKDNSPEVFKQTIVELSQILKNEGYKITDMPKMLDFLAKNSHIAVIVKNGNLTHKYIKSVIVSYFNNTDFIERI